MGKLYILVGKSASGKDAIYKRLLKDRSLMLKPYVGHTTRPKRDGETDGVEYYFDTLEKLEEYKKSGRLIEQRTYDTVHGDWHYYSVDSGDSFLSGESLIYIGTLESYIPLRDYYGADKVVPIYIEVDDGERLKRALARELRQEHPRFAEMCRRYLVDEEDFSEDKLTDAGIDRRFLNNDLEDCLCLIRQYILDKEAE